ncbi:MAG: bifunctional oligoribonuclease/PAP phosphatase NrnA [Victivallales bacterium]
MSNDITLAEVKDRLEQLRGKGRILLMTHERPDGDAVGSLCGMYFILRENGFFVDALIPESVPDMYQDFVPSGLITSITTLGVECYSLLIALDASTRMRVSASCIKEDGITIPCLNIDHHPDNERYGDASYVVPTACSTAEIVLSIAKAANLMISPVSATLLMLGIITDSGCFRFDNTTPEALRAAARLLELGADRRHIIRNCFLSKPENMARFEADLLCNHMKKEFGGKFAWFYLEPDLLKKYEVDLRNTEQVIESLRAIDGVVVAAVIRKEKEGFKVSLRSKAKQISVGKIARRLNGGGHEMAAGCSISVPTIEEAEKILANNVEMELNEK